jgi:hypothetical protein
MDKLTDGGATGDGQLSALFRPSAVSATDDGIRGFPLLSREKKAHFIWLLTKCNTRGLLRERERLSEKPLKSLPSWWLEACMRVAL